MLCTYLSAVLLVGLALNSLFGWSWADPIAAIVIAGVAIKEGVEAWKGDNCCTPAAAAFEEQDCDDDCCAGGKEAQR
jgi:Co/Zn/Cd efflux system component